MTAAAAQVTVDDLVGLWRGDELSCGYRHPALAFAVARHVNPQLGELLEGVPWSSIVHEDAEIVKAGFEAWERCGRPTVRG